jgi:hypothetical protein
VVPFLDTRAGDQKKKANRYRIQFSTRNAYKGCRRVHSIVRMLGLQVNVRLVPLANLHMMVITNWTRNPSPNRISLIPIQLVLDGRWPYGHMAHRLPPYDTYTGYTYHMVCTYVCIYGYHIRGYIRNAASNSSIISRRDRRSSCIVPDAFCSR